MLIERLLRDQDSTIEKAVTMCRAAESAKEHMKEFSEGHENVHQTSYIKKSKQKNDKLSASHNKKADSKFKKRQPSPSSAKPQSKCGWCGKKSYATAEVSSDGTDL